jgi:chromosome segregation protein
MFLKRITLTGFKSFAGKTVLDLEPGITGIVGPNGSGKSNLADAIRWALGEQSKGRLRLGDREEVVFAGTEKRAKASYAEVTLLFNNEAGTFPLDLTEVEITRRLYRSGEADYRLAGRSVRLSDIQALLAQAGFGVNTYAVIGQGMIDSLLLSSPTERKSLFDDAAGIRGPELSREAALRKLAATATNLTRLRDIAAELAPRLSLLERNVADAAEQAGLEQRVAQLRADLAGAQIAAGLAAEEAATDRLKRSAASAHELRHQLAETHRRLTTAQTETRRQAEERGRLQASLATLERRRDELGAMLTEAHAAVAAAQLSGEQAGALGRDLEAAQAELAAAQARQADLEAELVSNDDAAARALAAVERAGQHVAQVQATLVTIRKGTSDGTRDQYVDHALQILKTLAISLGSEDITMDQVRLLIHKAGRLLSHATRTGAAELLADIQSAQKQLEAAMAKRETAIEHQTNITITRRSLEIDLAHQHDATARAAERVVQLKASLEPTLAAAAGLTDLQATAETAGAALAEATAQLEERRRQVHAMAAVTNAADATAGLTGQLERIKAAVAAAEGGDTDLKEQLAGAKAAVANARQQALQQGVTPTDPAPHASVVELESELIRAEARLEARVSAHHDQITEYEEVSTRATELSAQITDLETAQADLEKVVAQLGELIQARFKDNFQALAQQFSAYFAQLFEGGKASLELEDSGGDGYGIIIKASPKGKRLVSIAALSGGERAMAGVALLAAILTVNPSPFVVLDEIDAALDEANSGRLATILGELARHSQLIVITHNRQTMQVANVLFGVTSSEHRASHLLSMRLEDAARLAAR